MRLHLVFALGLLPTTLTAELYHKVRLAFNFHPKNTVANTIQHDDQALASCSIPKRDNCDFYLSCLEAAVPCGREGYAIAYGDHYCHKFQSVLTRFSDQGKVWLSNAMYCLQEKLVPYATGQNQASCKAIQKYAFATHPSCYLDNGLCNLPPSDWLAILETVGTEGLFGSIDALIATLEAAGVCIDFYIWLIRNEFIDKAERRISSKEL